MKQKILIGVFLLCTFFLKSIFTLGQKITAKELIEQTSESVLIDNFYQISLEDYNNFTTNSSKGFLEKERSYILNFQSDAGLKGQLIVQIDFSGRLQYIGISRYFVDKFKKITKPKMILINNLEICTSGINSNWQIANCLCQHILNYLSD